MKVLIILWRHELRRLQVLFRLFGYVAILAGLVGALVISWGVVQASGPVSGHSQKQSKQPHVNTYGWNSVIVFKSGSGVVANYNYLNGHSRKLDSFPVGAGGSIDGASPDGFNMLYQITQGQQTMYYTLRQIPFQGYFFSHVAFDTGNALWLQDSRHVLISTRHFGLADVDTQTGSFEWLHFGANWFEKLLFQYNGYVYFFATGAGALHGGNLYRVRLGSGVPQDLGVNSIHMTNILFSPNGSAIYYQQVGASTTGLFAMNLDGTNAHQVRSVGVPVGFAADNALVFMQRVAGHEQVVKLGANPGLDQLLLADAVPGSSSADEMGAAFAPFGHALFIQGIDRDGQNRVWSDNLATDQKIILNNLKPGDAPLKLFGWDRMYVP